MLKCLMLVVGLCAVGPAAADTMSSARLLPGWQMPNGHYMAGVEIVLAPGWKTYWRAPGGSGIPPQFDWSGSENLASVQVYWPRPEVFEAYGLQSVGYHGRVVFPVEIVPQVPGAPIEINLDLFYGVCEQVCIPAQAQTRIDAMPGDDIARQAIHDALDARAVSASSAGFTAIVCAVEMVEDDLSFRAEMVSSGAAPVPYAVIETGRDDLVILPTTTRQEGDRLVIETDGAYYGTETAVIDRDTITLTLLGQDQAVEMVGCPGRS